MARLCAKLCSQAEATLTMLALAVGGLERRRICRLAAPPHRGQGVTVKFREFVGLADKVRLPDESTILWFRHRLEKHSLAANRCTLQTPCG